MKSMIEQPESAARQKNGEWLQSLVETRAPGFSLARNFYCDDAVFREDVARVFHRNWLFAGHACQVDEPGKYFVYEMGSESLLIVRGDDRKLRAFFNVCRHRGSLLCEGNAEGRAKKLVCPYHQWVFALDGGLHAARGMGEAFNAQEYSLHQAHARELGGLVFVCLSEEPPPFEEAQTRIGAQLQPHGLERAKICCTREYDVHANWKLIFENNRECYHCPGGHPEYCRANFADDTSQHEHRRARHEAFVEKCETRWRDLGLSTEFVDFRRDTWFLCGRVPLRAGFVSESLDGQPVAPLMGDLPSRDIGVWSLVTFPNCWAQLSSDYAMTTRLTPISPTHTRVRVDWLVDENAVEGSDYDVEKVTALWAATSSQDWKLCEENQAGVLSSRYTPGPYAPHLEGGVETFVRWYLNQLCRERTSC